MRKIWNFFTTVIVLIVVLLAAALVGVRIFGYTPYTVLSGSMEPTFHVGSLVYVKKVSPEDIKVGDAITFVLNRNNDVATHRVVSIDAADMYFHTKGDANNTEDSSPVHFYNLVGRADFTIPYLGYVSNWMTHPPGLYISVSAGIILVLLTFVPDLIRSIPDEESEKDKKHYNRKETENAEAVSAVSVVKEEKKKKKRRKKGEMRVVTSPEGAREREEADEELFTIKAPRSAPAKPSVSAPQSVPSVSEIIRSLENAKSAPKAQAEPQKVPSVSEITSSFENADSAIPTADMPSAHAVEPIAEKPDNTLIVTGLSAEKKIKISEFKASEG